MSEKIPGILRQDPDIHFGLIFGWRKVDEKAEKCGYGQITEAENGHKT